jgi:hypothetical protein
MSADVLDPCEDLGCGSNRFVEDVEVRCVEVIRVVKKSWRRNLVVMQLHVRNGNVE